MNYNTNHYSISVSSICLTSHPKVPSSGNIIYMPLTFTAICPGGGTNIKPTPAPTTAPTRPRPKICPAILRGLCTLPPVKGPCRARKKRFYYDQQTNQCRMFIYGGCRGNGNNFKTKKRCRQSCPSENTSYDYDNGYPFD